LSLAGLELECLYGDFDASEFSSTSRRMVVVARKSLDTQRTAKST
jgi:hypothetical protein